MSYSITANLSYSSGTYNVSATDSNSVSNTYTFTVPSTITYVPQHCGNSGTYETTEGVSGYISYTYNNVNYNITNYIVTQQNSSANCQSYCSINGETDQCNIFLYSFGSCSSTYQTFIGQGIVTSTNNGDNYNVVLSTSTNIPYNSSTINCSNYQNAVTTATTNTQYTTTFVFTFSNNNAQVVITLNNTYNGTPENWSVNSLTIANSNASSSVTYADDNQMAIAIGFISNVYFGIGYEFQTDTTIVTNSFALIGTITPLIPLYLASN